MFLELKDDGSVSVHMYGGGEANEEARQLEGLGLTGGNSGLCRL